MPEYEFKILLNPDEDMLNEWGKKGYRMVGVVNRRNTVYDLPSIYEDVREVYMQREIGAEEFSLESAVRNGVRDGFERLTDTSDARLRKIFGPSE